MIDDHVHQDVPVRYSFGVRVYCRKDNDGSSSFHNGAHVLFPLLQQYTSPANGFHDVEVLHDDFM